MANGEAIIIQDADLEYDPNDYTNMLQLLINDECKVVSVNGYRSGCFLIHTIAVLIADYIIKSLIYKDMILATILK